MSTADSSFFDGLIKRADAFASDPAKPMGAKYVEAHTTGENYVTVTLDWSSRQVELREAAELKGAE